MKRRLVIVSGVLIGFLVLTFGVIFNPWFWELDVVPMFYRNRFRINADIIPAAREERAMFVSINPQFRVQFGDRENPYSAFLRFSAVEGDRSARLNNEINLNPFENTSEVIAALQDSRVFGVELTLFSTTIYGMPTLATSDLDEHEELIRLARELLGEEEATPSSEIADIEERRQRIQTETIALRENNQDVVRNMSVAPDIDISYHIEAGRGIRSQIIIGDREHYDTACLSALSQGVSELCDLPRNRFSFLLDLDPGLSLHRSRVSV
ncbi:MAG: hypothetical protein LBG64_00015, partial [Pseudomonadales bacterium]|nr:hypothetical protein [Pseudomonadales bacterium]